MPCFNEALSISGSKRVLVFPHLYPWFLIFRRLAWDSIFDSRHLTDQFRSFASSMFAAWLCTESKEAGAWLNALPIVSIGLRMEPDVFHVAIGLRLGLSVGISRNCGAEVDQLGLHGLTCSGRGCLFVLVPLITSSRNLDSAKVPSIVEPSSILRSDNKRPWCINYYLESWEIVPFGM